MSPILADFLDSLPAWWERHGMPVCIISLIGIAIADRFLAGVRGRAAVGPETDDYADPIDNPGVPDER